MKGAPCLSFAQALQQPIPQPKFYVTHRKPELISEELGFTFSDVEVESAAEDLKYALFLKFLSCRPSINVLQMIIIKTWGFTVRFIDKFHFFFALPMRKTICMHTREKGELLTNASFACSTGQMICTCERNLQLWHNRFFYPVCLFY